jgi:SAM-dependent methyltransferase
MSELELPLRDDTEIASADRPTRATDADRDCPICRSGCIAPYAEVDGKTYLDCSVCHAVHLDRAQRPSLEQELAYYRLHHNLPDDPGYRSFLSTLVTPLLARLKGVQHGLDFGCGPGPALAEMLREAGHRITLYDPLFYPNPAALERRYAFITLSEVAEHLHHPADTFRQLFELLRPGGMLAVMTGFPPPAEQFDRWHYRRDPTHVVFYPPSTLRWIAHRHDAECEIPCPNVALMRRRR